MISANKFWFGVGVSALLLILFLVTVDLGSMLDALADANYLYVIPGIGLYLISVLFRTLRWQVLLRHMRPVQVRRLYPVVVVGYMANNLLPMRLGEFVRSYYVGEREGISKTSALATILVERVLDALTLLLLISAISVAVPLAGLAESFADRFGVPWPLLIVAFSVPFVATFAVLVMFALFPSSTRALAMRLIPIAPLPQRSQEPLRDLVDMFLDGLQPLRSQRKLALLFLLSVPIWMFEAALFLSIGYSFGLQHVYDNPGEMAVALVLVTAIANIGSSVPAAPGGTGLFEIITRETLVLLPLAAVDRSVAGSFAIVVHASLLLPMILLGQMFLWTEHLSLHKLSKATRVANTGRTSFAAVEHPIARTALSTEIEDSP